VETQSGGLCVGRRLGDGVPQWNPVWGTRYARVGCGNTCDDAGNAGLYMLKGQLSALQ